MPRGALSFKDLSDAMSFAPLAGGGRRVLLATMGGTIAATRGPDGLFVFGRRGIELLAAVKDAEEVQGVQVKDLVVDASSRTIGPAQMCDLAHTVTQAIDDGFGGIVVTHGTDTLEETIYALALQVQPRVPIVATGAMRPLDEPGSDGLANLAAALRAARDDRTAQLGPVVLFHDEIHLAKWVSKVHTSRTAAFASPGVGPSGWIAEGAVYLLSRPTEVDFLGLPDQLERRVEVVPVTAGCDGLLVDAAAEAADGLIVAGTGGGHVPGAMASSIARALRRGLQVVLASRTGAGPILRSTYGGPGSETHLLELGVLPAGTLSPRKARLRLMVALQLGIDPASCFPA